VFALGHTAGALRRSFAVLRGRLSAARDQSGFALIEVMVSAALLAVVGIGIYNGIDGPAAISGTDRLRSVAAGVAQRENERLHSLSFDDLQKNQLPVKTYNLQGNTFTATSTTRWVSDQSGSESCTNNSTSVDYLALTTTVTWRGMGSRSVTMRSIESPPTGTGTNLRGNLTVQIIDEKVPGQPVKNLPVTIDGPTRLTVNTNDEGCAVFPYIPVGNYHGTFQQTGWVDPSNAAIGAFDTTVTGNSTTAVPEQFGQASAVDVQFEDSAGNNATWSSASVISSGMSSPLQVYSTPANSLVNGVTTGYTLFPITSGYSAWAGDCPNPMNTLAQGGWGVTTANPSANVTPGAASTIRVKLPTVNLESRSNSTTLIGNANIYITPTAACSDPGPAPLSTRPNSPLKTSNVAGATFGKKSIPLPYGDYTICVDNGARRRTRTVQNRAAAGTALQTFDVSSTGGGQSGVC
jgi:prepilin-type N-terminal cleavage/methylation domain-containing protein